MLAEHRMNGMEDLFNAGNDCVLAAESRPGLCGRGLVSETFICPSLSQLCDLFASQTSGLVSAEFALGYKGKLIVELSLVVSQTGNSNLPTRSFITPLSPLFTLFVVFRFLLCLSHLHTGKLDWFRAFYHTVRNYFLIFLVFRIRTPLLLECLCWIRVQTKESQFLWVNFISIQVN